MPNIPNPLTILSQVPTDSKWFSVIDLPHVFFNILVDLNRQFWFANVDLYPHISGLLQLSHYL